MIKCDICGKTNFKSKAGLEGHKKIVHGVEKRKSYPDKIGKRLDNIEALINTNKEDIDFLSKKFIGIMQGVTENIRDLISAVNIIDKHIRDWE
jgi:hypothetical protein